MSQVYLHKWMYSFLPAGRLNDLYLVAFCPECRQGATVAMEKDGNYTGKTVLTPTDLPIEGCVEPRSKTIKVDGLN